MSRILCLGLSMLLVLALPRPALASTPESTALDRYLDGLLSWRAEFSQTTTDSRGRVREPQRGRLLVQRPGRFRWEIAPPEQVMVADGRNVWFYDRELEQVTVRAAGSALSATPAMLLAGTVPLRSAFTVRDAGRRDGLEWVRVAPQRTDGEFREALFGFAGLELRRLEIDDKLGQKTQLVFAGGERNARIDPAELQFTPPPGADLIGRPVP
jgi:outer membrane lipoprotein carrier protein